MSDEQPDNQLSSADAEAYKLLYEQTRETLLHYLQSYKEISLLPLAGGRAAKIEIMGSTPCTDDDLTLIIAHLQLMKRTKVFTRKPLPPPPQE